VLFCTLLGQAPELVNSEGVIPGISTLLQYLPVWRNEDHKCFAFASNGLGQNITDIFSSAGVPGARLTDDVQTRQTKIGLKMMETVYNIMDPQRKVEVARSFLDKGADVNAIKRGSSESVLSRFSNINESHLVVRELLEAGADINARTLLGETCLHKAAKGQPAGGAPMTLKVLLEDKWGADLNLTTFSGKTAFMVARGRFGVPDNVESQDERFDSTKELLTPKTPTRDAFAAALSTPDPLAAVLRLLMHGNRPGQGVDIETGVSRQTRMFQRFQLYDMLWADGHDTSVPTLSKEEDQRIRSQLKKNVIDRLFVPLVQKARHEVLPSFEKQLLHHVAIATAGPSWVKSQDGRMNSKSEELEDPRGDHRAQWTSLLDETMEAFAVELGDAYDICQSMPGGSEMCMLPCVQMWDDRKVEALRQDSEFCMGPVNWLRSDGTFSGNLVAAFCVLRQVHAIKNAFDFAKLLGPGLHSSFASPHPLDFRDPLTNDSYLTNPLKLGRFLGRRRFWIRLGALRLVHIHALLEEDFNKCMASVGTQFDHLGVHFKPAPLKKYERVVTKADAYAEENQYPDTALGADKSAGHVVDILRCTFVVPSPEVAVALCEWFDKATVEAVGFRPLRRKNGFHSEAKVVGGYRDIKYNVLFKSPALATASDAAAAGGTRLSSCIAEVQILLSSFLVVKERCHAVYKLHRGDFG
jgi:hypothetical protein